MPTKRSKPGSKPPSNSPEANIKAKISTSSHSDSDSPHPSRKKPKKLTKRPVVNFDGSNEDDDPSEFDRPVITSQKKSLAEHTKRRLSGKFGPRRSVNPNAPNRTHSSGNLENTSGTPMKASGLSSNHSSPMLEAGGGGGGGRVGALARVRENQARNANRTSTGFQSLGVGGAISTEVMNNNYDEWMKMATDNKINVNNTWSFALIDYFHDMSLLRNPEAQGGINFQKASCTLDGCVKIWTSRVDSVATETGKLLSGLAEEANNLANRTMDGNSSDEEMGTDSVTKVKKPRTRTANANSSSLVDFNDKLKVKDLELEFTVDPLFKKTCADFDEGGPGGILMSHLAIDSSMTIVFDASGKPISSQDDDKDDANNPEEEEQPLIDVSKLKCNILPLSPPENPHELAPNDQGGGDGGGDGGGADFFDTGYFPDHQGEGMDFGDEDDEDNGGVGLGSSTFNAGKMPNEKDLVMALVDDPSNTMTNGAGGESSGMFDYFDKSLKKMWAGPEHWKLRRTVLSKTRDEEGQSTMTRTRREKSSFSFDFTQPLDITRKAIFQPSAVALTLPGYKPPKPKSQRRMIKKITGSKTSAGSKQMLEQHCLPDDMHFNAAQLLRFDMKPRATFNMRVRSGGGAVNPNQTHPTNNINPNPTGEIDENYWAQTAAAAAQSAAAEETNDQEDANGAVPFATQFFQDEENDDIADFEEEFDNPVGLLPPASTTTPIVPANDEEDLLAATQNLNTRVRPEFVSYAKKAKRVDVKKLKENIWRELEELTKELEDEDRSAQRENEAEEVEKPKTFTKVIGGLRNMYPKEKMEEISTSFCFICLLHLANEKGLSIKSTDSKHRNKVLEAEEEDEARFVGSLEALKVVKEAEDE
ncbi:hypothetical protein CROQUDRAFT_49175 [Cronartium quercuum f. sp. fusiforme G11]|uniref:Condensin complex subunit 2 n=1 Tax=Cronartium quercuum f. sp. fusiforme G11 TaxID=708437 RepID=A0A9P6NBS2_9BASI|nr:hypothetical protein CROQUDRAFT_49175 [Cronartium quercuum f. sp. fusiforme G11]